MPCSFGCFRLSDFWCFGFSGNFLDGLFMKKIVVVSCPLLGRLWWILSGFDYEDPVGTRMGIRGRFNFDGFWKLDIPSMSPERGPVGTRFRRILIGFWKLD